MKKRIFAVLAACCLLAAPALHAQRPAHRQRTAEEMAKYRTERMAEQLKLDDVQQQQIYRSNLDFAQQMRRLHAERRAASDTTARTADRERMQELYASYDAQLKKNLSRDQYRQWSEQQERYRQGMRHRRGGGDRRPAARTERR